MNGFEPGEVVGLAATIRPETLDPALQPPRSAAPRAGVQAGVVIDVQRRVGEATDGSRQRGPVVVGHVKAAKLTAIGMHDLEGGSP